MGSWGPSGSLGVLGVLGGPTCQRRSPSGLGPSDGLQQIQTLTKFKHQVEIVLANRELHQSWVVQPFYLVWVLLSKNLGFFWKVATQACILLVHESYVQLQSSLYVFYHHHFARGFSILSIIIIIQEPEYQKRTTNVTKQYPWPSRWFVDFPSRNPSCAPLRHNTLKASPCAATWWRIPYAHYAHYAPQWLEMKRNAKCHISANNEIMSGCFADSQWPPAIWQQVDFKNFLQESISKPHVELCGILFSEPSVEHMVMGTNQNNPIYIYTHINMYIIIYILYIYTYNLFLIEAGETSNF